MMSASTTTTKSRNIQMGAKKLNDALNIDVLDRASISFDWPPVSISRAGLSRYLIEKCLFHRDNVLSVFENVTEKPNIDTENDVVDTGEVKLNHTPNVLPVREQEAEVEWSSGRGEEEQEEERGTTVRMFTYRQVLVDCLRMASIVRNSGQNKPTRGRNKLCIGISGDNGYEHLCSLLTALLIDCVVVPIQFSVQCTTSATAKNFHRSTAKQNKQPLDQVIENCHITQLWVGRQLKNRKVVHRKNNIFGRSKTSNSSLSCDASRQKTAPQASECPFLKHPISIDFGGQCQGKRAPSSVKKVPDYEQLSDVIDLCRVAPLDASFLGIDTQDNRVRVVIPKFKNKSHRFSLEIDEATLLTQINHATLPQCGFEWNSQDTVLNLHSLSSWMGILEFLVCISVGARFALQNCGASSSFNDVRDRSSDHDVATLLARLSASKATAAILHSSQVVELLKAPQRFSTPLSLRKIIYYGQPLHRSLVDTFRDRYQLTICKYGLYMENCGGFLAMQHCGPLESELSNMLMPLPGVRMAILDPYNRPLAESSLGKVFVCPPTEIRVRHVQYSRRRRKMPSHCVATPVTPTPESWQFCHYVGFHQCGKFVALIDHYCNLIRIEKRTISKGLIETILLAHSAVRRVLVTQSKPKMITAFIQLHHENDASADDEGDEDFTNAGAHRRSNFEDPSICLDAYLKDFQIEWQIVFVNKLARRGVNRLYTMKNLLKKNIAYDYNEQRQKLSAHAQ